MFSVPFTNYTMMRLTRAQFASLKLLTIGLIAADLFAIWVWATRPPRIYSDWLGLDSLHSETPSLPSRQLGCLERRAPHTFRLPDVVRPGRIGLLGRAPARADLPHHCFCSAPREIDAPMWRRMSAKVGVLRFRMRTALALVAVFGVYIGWEVHAWRTWRLRSDYRRPAAQASIGVDSNLSTLRSIREERAHIPRFRANG